MHFNGVGNGTKCDESDNSLLNSSSFKKGRHPHAAFNTRPTTSTTKTALLTMMSEEKPLITIEQQQTQKPCSSDQQMLTKPPLDAGGNIFNDENAELCECACCQKPIYDQFVYKVLDRSFHELCLRCADCQQPFGASCYTRHGNELFCREHFIRRFGPKCSRCGESIGEQCSVRRANHHIYHVPCFQCAICNRELATGDQFYLIPIDGRLVCRQDFELAQKECEMNGSNSKRPRTTIPQKSLELLRQAYQRSSKPSRNVREELARQTGLDMRVVQVWFQNKRAKEKRLKRDAGIRRWTLHNGGAGSGRSDSGSSSVIEGAGGSCITKGGGGQRGGTLDSSDGSINDSESLAIGNSCYLDLDSITTPTSPPQTAAELEQQQSAMDAQFGAEGRSVAATAYMLSNGDFFAGDDSVLQQLHQLQQQQQQHDPGQRDSLATANNLSNLLIFPNAPSQQQSQQDGNLNTLRLLKVEQLHQQHDVVLGMSSSEFLAQHEQQQRTWRASAAADSASAAMMLSQQQQQQLQLKQQQEASILAAMQKQQQHCDFEPSLHHHPTTQQQQLQLQQMRHMLMQGESASCVTPAGIHLGQFLPTV